MQDLEKIKQSVNPEEIVEPKEELPKKEITPVDIETQAEELQSWALKEAEGFKNETIDGITKIENSVNLPQEDVEEIKKETNITEDLDEINKEVDQITKFDYIKSKIKQILNVMVAGVVLGALPNKSEAQPPKKLEPIVVHDKNDPILKAYQDSVAVVGATREIYNKFVASRKPGYSFSRTAIHEIPPNYITDAPIESMGDYPELKKANEVLNNSKLKPAAFWEYDDKKSIDDIDMGLWSVITGKYKDANKMKDAFGFTIPIYKQPVQPVVYKPKQEIKGNNKTPEKPKVEEDKDYQKKMELYNHTQQTLNKFKTQNPGSTFKVVETKDVPVLHRYAEFPVKNYIAVNYNTESPTEIQYVPNYEKPIINKKPQSPYSKKELELQNKKINNPDVWEDKNGKMWQSQNPEGYNYKPKPKPKIEAKKDPQIIHKQQDLKDAGFYKGVVDGVWGKGSEEAFQAYNKDARENKMSPMDIDGRALPIEEVSMDTLEKDKAFEKVTINKDKPIGTINIHGRAVQFYSEEQKNELLEKLAPYKPTQIGSSNSYGVSRFNEQTKGWNDNKLYGKNEEVLIDLGDYKFVE